MTTIVIDVKAQKVHTDTLVTTHTQHMSNFELFIGKKKPSKNARRTISHSTISKAHQCDDYIIVGAGSLDVIHDFNRQYPKRIPPAVKNTTIMVLSAVDGGVRVVMYTAKVEGLLRRVVWEESTYVKTSGFVVFGSGSDYAYGALMAGVDPEKAIIAASRCDSSTNDIVESYDIPITKRLLNS